MAEPGWQPIPAMSAPVEVAAAKARPPEAGFAVGDTAFASPTTGWAWGAPYEQLGLVFHEMGRDQDAVDAFRQTRASSPPLARSSTVA